MSKKLDPVTQAIRIQTPKSSQQEHSTPLYITSSFTFDEAESMRAAFADETDDNIYSRFSNPNVDEFVAKMCALEGADAGFATSTGMSAIFCTSGLESTVVVARAVPARYREPDGGTTRTMFSPNGSPSSRYRPSESVTARI